jgi:hypothetical protein
LECGFLGGATVAAEAGTAGSSISEISNTPETTKEFFIKTLNSTRIGARAAESIEPIN